MEAFILEWDFYVTFQLFCNLGVYEALKNLLKSLRSNVTALTVNVIKLIQRPMLQMAIKNILSSWCVWRYKIIMQQHLKTCKY